MIEFIRNTRQSFLCYLYDRTSQPFDKTLLNAIIEVVEQPYKFQPAIQQLMVRVQLLYTPLSSYPSHFLSFTF